MECKDCHKDKPATEFYGVQRNCKECFRAAVRKNREANIERIREYDRERGRTPERLALQRENNKRWRKANPDKANAHRIRYPEKYKASMAVNNAIYRGKLIRQSCETCGGFGEAHHDDYAKPLEVRWLCRKHHAEQHRRYKEENNDQV